MKYLRALGMAFGTFSIFPAPHTEWNDSACKYMICFLPAVGAVPGAALLLWHFLCIKFMIPAVLFASVSVFLPLFLTGGIHMDGFMDTWDAIGSHQTRERKLEIMKDSHTGAFAVMSCTVYLLLLFSFYDAAAHAFPAVTVALGFLLSRALSGIGTMVLPNARGTGMLAHLQEEKGKPGILAVLISVSVACAVLMILSSPLSGAWAVILSVGWFLFYCIFSMKTFGGATGDTTGFCIEMTELMILLGAAAGGMIG
jgi:adenosylcobinamide-GDP ribazoletransferase